MRFLTGQPVCWLNCKIDSANMQTGAMRGEKENSSLYVDVLTTVRLLRLSLFCNIYRKVERFPDLNLYRDQLRHCEHLIS